MIFEPGNSYYMLTVDQLNEMVALADDLGIPHNFLEDFQLAEDGNFYTAAGNIDSDELAFLNDWGYNNCLDYKKSYQSTSIL